MGVVFVSAWPSTERNHSFSFLVASQCNMTPPNEQLEKLVNPTVDLEQSECKSADTSDGAKTDWRSIYITSFLSFCTAAQFSLYFASLWPFLNVVSSILR